MPPRKKTSSAPIADWQPPLEGPPPGRPWGLWMATLIACAVLAAVTWWLVQDFRKASTGEVRPASPAMPTAAGEGNVSDTQAQQRRDQILTCRTNTGEVFYTNAISCEQADLENRVNVVPATGSSQPLASDCLGIASAGTTHHFLAACQEPFSEALRLEAHIIKASKPANSSRLPEYCDLIAEGVTAGCLATSQTFCFLPLCQQRMTP